MINDLLCIKVVMSYDAFGDTLVIEDYLLYIIVLLIKNFKYLIK